jgi:hypothetical protein
VAVELTFCTGEIACLWTARKVAFSVSSISGVRTDRTGCACPNLDPPRASRLPLADENRHSEVSKTRQHVGLASVYTFTMAEPIRMLTVEREGEDGLIVTFSDGTTAGYVTEELLGLRPFREPTEKLQVQAAPKRQPMGQPRA